MSAVDASATIGAPAEAGVEAGVAVVVPAFNAADTIGAAVRSALAQRGVSEVCVVDDASTDGTVEAARAADDGTGRLLIERLALNGGPAAARNRALDATRAPLIAVLDADDRFVPDRFAALPPAAGWDLFADNVAFRSTVEALERMAPPEARAPRPLDLAAFVGGNVSRPGRPRGELGFLKPVLSRAFLGSHGLRYDERLRLGEDYDLYARALARGARLLVSPQVGYAALLRPDSLSARHRTADLAALAAVDDRLLADPDVPEAARRPIRRHRRQTLARHALRRFLDRRAVVGRRMALRELLGQPGDWVAIAGGVARDKLRDLIGPPTPARTLLPVADASNGDAP